MRDNPGNGSALPVERAFVVQLSADADLDAQRVTGRVEHVVSGETSHFQTLEQLLAFIAGLTGGAPAAPAGSES